MSFLSENKKGIYLKRGFSILTKKDPTKTSSLDLPHTCRPTSSSPAPRCPRRPCRYALYEGPVATGPGQGTEVGAVSTHSLTIEAFLFETFVVSFPAVSSSPSCLFLQEVGPITATRRSLLLRRLRSVRGYRYTPGHSSTPDEDG